MLFFPYLQLISFRNNIDFFIVYSDEAARLHCIQYFVKPSHEILFFYSDVGSKIGVAWPKQIENLTLVVRAVTI